MTFTVTIVGGPRDDETIENPGNRVHIAVLADPSAVPPPTDDPRGLNVHEAVLPVRLTRDGYRAYWSERQ